MSESYNTNEFELEKLCKFFDEYIKDHVYFSIRKLAIEFLTNNTSLTYKEASTTEGFLGMIMRFSKIITQAKREEIVEKYNANTYKVIKNVK